MKIENPDGRGLDPELYWMVSRVAIVEEHYFDNEKEAREFAARHCCFTVDAPVKLSPLRAHGVEVEG